MIEDKIETLHINPFFCSHILVHFFSGFNAKEISIAPAYLVLPLVLFEPTNKKLNELNNRSSLASAFAKNSSLLVDLQIRVDELKHLTNLSLIVAHNHEQILLSDKINILKTEDYHNEILEVSHIFKAAYYFGVICSKEANYSEIFRFFKVVI